jgi:hypothetical protein
LQNFGGSGGLLHSRRLGRLATGGENEEAQENAEESHSCIDRNRTATSEVDGFNFYKVDLQ